MEYSFNNWMRRRHHLAPEADRLLPLIAGAGAMGMSRKQLGHAIKLDRDVLDELLDGLVQVGMLSVADEAGTLVYRCV